jgi:hypothetical protein
MLSLVICPEPSCGALAEIVDRQSLRSTDGPVEHVATNCLNRHRFFLPVDMLHAPPPDVPRSTVERSANLPLGRPST